MTFELFERPLPGFSKPPPSWRRLDSNRIARLYQRGFSTHQIAEHLGIGQTSVRYHLKKMKVNMRTKSEAGRNRIVAQPVNPQGGANE